jgi:hypothetical protein
VASQEVYDAIRAKLTDAWDATPIAWPNEEFTFPVRTDAVPTPHWIAVIMTGTLYGQQSIGESAQADNRWDEEGILWLHTYSPSGAGEAVQRGYCKQLADIFRGLTLLDGSLEFGDAAIESGEIGDDNGAWWRISVSIEWRRMDA